MAQKPRKPNALKRHEAARGPRPKEVADGSAELVSHGKVWIRRKR